MKSNKLILTVVLLSTCRCKKKRCDYLPGIPSTARLPVNANDPAIIARCKRDCEHSHDLSILPRDPVRTIHVLVRETANARVYAANRKAVELCWLRD